MQVERITQAILASTLSGFLLLGCSSTEDSASAPAEPAAGAEGVAAEAPASPASPVAAGAEAPPSKIDMEAVRNEARTAMFVPAPTEFQAALKAGKVEIDLKSLVTDEDRSLDGKQRTIIALETGVRLSNLLMSVQEGEKATLLNRMKRARAALVALQAPQSLVAEIDKVLGSFGSGDTKVKELGPSLDLLAEKVREELRENADANVATLVEAGGWVQGAHLLSTAIGNAGLAGDSAALLRQPTVLAHFLNFLKDSDPARAGDPDVVAVIKEMEAMQVLASKPELANEDVRQVAVHTGNILARF